MGETTILDSARSRAPVDHQILASLREAMEKFSEPSEAGYINDGDMQPRKHPDAQLEKYFHYVTVYGKPCLEWELVRPVFLWKLKHVLKEMVRIDHLVCDQSNARAKQEDSKEGAVDNVHKTQTVNGVKREICPKKSLPKVKADFEDSKGELRVLYDLIIDTAEKLEGFPFTFQRICELMKDPVQLYQRAEKFFRAIDKCINVVTKITPNGQRITGIEEPFVGIEENGRIEQTFFGKVDEVDDGAWGPVAVASVASQNADDKPLDMSKKEPARIEAAEAEPKIEPITASLNGAGDAPVEKKQKLDGTDTAMEHDGALDATPASAEVTMETN
ncbi:unnamed protein product, partial [Mesorhabditis spiculigera]